MKKELKKPSKKGFLRFFEVWWTLGVITMILQTAFATKTDFRLDYNSFLNYVYTFTNAICVLFLIKRKRVTIRVVTGTSLVAIAITLITVMFMLGEYNDFGLIVGAAILVTMPDVLTIIYFNTSRRAKAILVEPFSVEAIRDEAEKASQIYNLKSWPFWRNLIIYFCIFSVVGHWMEAGYCTFIKYGIIPGTYDPNSQIWSDWLYPFPVYGIGAVACVLLLYPVKTLLQKNVRFKYGPLIGSFVINALVCTLIELIMGLTTNTPPGPDGKLPLWDYSDMFCNFMGQICLQNAVAFGVASTLMVWFIYPALEHLIGRFSKDQMNVAFVLIVLFFIMLTALYLVTMPSSPLADIFLE